MEALLLGAGLLLGAYVLVYYNLVKAPPCGGIGSLRGRTAVVTGEWGTSAASAGGGRPPLRGGSPGGSAGSRPPPAGANSGIGKMTALELARRGARVVLACRSRERGEAAAFDLRQVRESRSRWDGELRTRRGVGTMRSIFMALDLAVLASVRAFATAFLRSEPRLDILIHNAGCPYFHLRDWDTFNLLLRVNHIGPFLLTHMLLLAPEDILDFTRLDRPVWAGSKSCGHMPTGKLANVLFARELATQLEGTGVTCYAAHPGPVNSELFLRHVPGWLRPLLRPLAWLVLRAPKGGAQTPLYCALQEGIEPLSGRYFANCHVEEVPPVKAEPEPLRLLTPTPGCFPWHFLTLKTSAVCQPIPWALRGFHFYLCGYFLEPLGVSRCIQDSFFPG
uniref:Dehydrogenase/reductase 13 n=1 Tax=Sciurus vulgaris TaxID=55149 RepID=A0A8D2DJM9_SCIVU